MLYCAPGGSVTPAGGIFVAVEDAVNVIGAFFLVLGERVDNEPGKTALVGARFGQVGHVGRQRAAVGGSRSLLVGKRRRKTIGNLARPLKHFALVVRASGHLESGRYRRSLRFGEAWAARIGKIAKCQKLQTVTV